MIWVDGPDEVDVLALCFETGRWWSDSASASSGKSGSDLSSLSRRGCWAEDAGGVGCSDSWVLAEEAVRGPEEMGAPSSGACDGAGVEYLDD